MKTDGDLEGIFRYSEVWKYNIHFLVADSTQVENKIEAMGVYCTLYGSRLNTGGDWGKFSMYLEKLWHFLTQ